MNFQVTSMKTMAGLKRNMVVALMMLSSLSVAAQSGMTDTQVMQFVAREAKAGTSQSQIVTKLMQRGVKIDQIRRVRNQYDKQIRSHNMSAAADAAAAGGEFRRFLRGCAAGQHRVFLYPLGDPLPPAAGEHRSYRSDHRGGRSHDG